jgi:hypothetical protein
MTPLESRKRLLIAESDLNRAQLLAEIQELRSGLDRIFAQTGFFGTLISTLKIAANTFSALRSSAPGSPGGRHPWWTWLSRGAEVALSLWRTFRRS